MKKLLSFITVLVAAAALASAEVAIGARGFIDWGIGTGVDAKDYKLDLQKSLSFGGALFGKVPISAIENLYVQPELGFAYNTIGEKYNKGGLKKKYTISYSSLILPVLIAYDFPINQSFILTVEGGPQLSYIMGKLNYDWKATEAGVTVKGDGDVNPDSRLLFSGIIGVGASYSFTPGMALVTDLRYDLGFSTVKAKDADDGFKPRGLVFSAGFQVRF